MQPRRLFGRVVTTAIIGLSTFGGGALAQTVDSPPPAFADKISPPAWRLFLQGHTAQSQNSLSVALDDLNQSIALSPSFFPAYMDLGITYFKMERCDSAVKDFAKAIEIGNGNPMLSTGYKLLGICYRKLNRPADAVRVYTDYINGTGASDWDGINQRGEAYALAGDAANARKDYERALTLSPGNPKILGSMTVLDAKTKDWRRALDDSTRWLAVEPGQSLALKVQAAARQHLGAE